MESKRKATTKSSRGKSKARKVSNRSSTRAGLSRVQPIAPERSKRATERRQAEAALRESEERCHLFRGILQSSSDGILAVNRESKVLFTNERFAELWRIPQELIAKNDDTLLLRYVLDQLSDPQGFLQKVQELYDSTEESLDTLDFKDGRVFDRLSRPMLQGRELRGRVWSFRDITARKRAEEALRESEARFHSLFDNASIGIYRTTPDGRTLLSNPAGVRLLGYNSFEELAHRSLEEEGFEPDYERSHFRERMKREGTVIGLESAWKRKDGSTIYVRESATAVKDSNGNIIHYDGTFEDITERKQAEEALRESEERYRSLIDHMLDGFYRSSHQGKFVDVNPAMVKMFGYSSKEEMLEVDIKNALYFAPGERGSHVLDTGQEEMDVYRMRRKDGSELWVEDHGSYVHDEQGRIIFHEGILRDITARKQIEDALSASEAELRALFASMQDVVLVIDQKGVYRKIGPTNPGLLVKPPEELLGKNLKDVFPAEQAEAFREVVQQVLDTGQNRQIEYELLIGDHSVWFQTTVSPLNADSTLWVAHDITNRKQVEEALRTAEANYRSIFDNATVGIYQSTPQGRFLNINPVMTRTFGYDSPEEMLGDITSIENQYYVDPADRQEFQRLMREQGEVREFCSWNRRKDGVQIWIQENARAVKDAKGNTLYYEGFITDITTHKQVEEALRRAKDALESAHYDLQQSLAHEQLLARTDSLTGLCNRRQFFELAAREFSAAVRYQRRMTIVMFDADNFKQINDVFGHAEGDKILAQIAQLAASQVRAVDLLARYGGDEFILLLPQTETQQALQIAERIRTIVGTTARVETDRGPFSITLSFGIAELQRNPRDENVERIIQHADEALYEAKAAGRNRIVIHIPEHKTDLGEGTGVV